MQHNNLSGMRVAILLSDDFELVEMTEPREALEQAGATTMIVSPAKGPVTGMKHDEKVASFKVDVSLDQANPNDFDAVLLPGGALNADSLRMVPKAQEFIRQIDQSGRPIAVICHAPWLLVSAGCVKGRTLTS
ncbi:MAG TPA: DJ-1/PfpI family protein, partial [Ktedonobacteraceae bacterium]|nr:DJ-1/PfpI family protein [Ktedonobacteraceae bacterium]